MLDLIPWPWRVGLSLLGAAVLAVTVMWVVGLGPFNTRPSVAAKAIPVVQATVAQVQTQAATAVATAEDKTKAASAATQQKVEVHVAKIRAAPDSGADAEFYSSVCDTKFYEGSADCRGFGGKPEGDDPAHGARALRRR